MCEYMSDFFPLGKCPVPFMGKLRFGFGRDVHLLKIQTEYEPLRIIWEPELREHRDSYECPGSC